MVSKQLLRYVEKEDKLGKSKKEIKEILISAGWHKDAVSEAFDAYYKANNDQAKKDSKKKDIKISVKTEEEKTPEKTDEIESLPESEKENKGENKLEKDTVKPEETLKNKEKKRRVRPVFLYIFFFFIGAGLMFSVLFFLSEKSAEQASSVQNDSGFIAQKIDDAKRITEILKVQDELEKYYIEHKSYPENINNLQGLPQVSTDLNYTYTPIGSPAQSYTLNIEMKSTDNNEFKVDGGFMTLKNKQGTK